MKACSFPPLASRLGGLPDPMALLLVGFQQVFPGLAVEAALIKVLALSVLAVVVQELVQASDADM